MLSERYCVDPLVGSQVYEAMPHVVHLTSSTFFGGPERQILGLCGHLPLGYRSSILAFSESGACRQFEAEARRRGVDFHVVPDDFRGTLQAVDELNRALVSVDPDILCCHGYKANLVGGLAAHAIGLPALCVLRGWTGEDCKVKVYEHFDRFVLTRFRSVVCLSRAQASAVQAAGVSPDRIRLIPNAIDVGRFPPLCPEQREELIGLFPTRPRLVCCAAGRLSPEKGFVDLVRAAALVVRDCPDVGFVLYGEGQTRPQLREEIHLLGLASRFILAGFSTRLDRSLAAGDLVAIPSYTEGMPNVLLEAFAAGLPVVATPVGGIPELVTDGENGFLVAPGDVSALAARLRHLVHDGELRRDFGTSGRALVETAFSFQAQGERYHQLVQEMLQSSAVSVAVA